MAASLGRDSRRADGRLRGSRRGGRALAPRALRAPPRPPRCWGSPCPPARGGGIGTVLNRPRCACRTAPATATLDTMRGGRLALAGRGSSAKGSRWGFRSTAKSISSHTRASSDCVGGPPRRSTPHSVGGACSARADRSALHPRAAHRRTRTRGQQGGGRPGWGACRLCSLSRAKRRSGAGRHARLARQRAPTRPCCAGAMRTAQQVKALSLLCAPERARARVGDSGVGSAAANTAGKGTAKGAWVHTAGGPASTPRFHSDRPAARVQPMHRPRDSQAPPARGAAGSARGASLPPPPRRRSSKAGEQKAKKRKGAGGDAPRGRARAVSVR